MYAIGSIIGFNIDHLEDIANNLKIKADFENANREARAYKRLVAHIKAYKNTNNEVTRFYIELALEKALDYAFLALGKERYKILYFWRN